MFPQCSLQHSVSAVHPLWTCVLMRDDLKNRAEVLAEPATQAFFLLVDIFYLKFQSKNLYKLYKHIFSNKNIYVIL